MIHVANMTSWINYKRENMLQDLFFYYVNNACGYINASY